MTPTSSNDTYPEIDNLSDAQLTHITRFRHLMQQAVPAVFEKFRALRCFGLTYHKGSGQDVPGAIFAPNQVSNVQVVDDTDGGSDEVLFTKAGIPCATMVDDTSYYNNNPSPWAYPYDQPQDTVQLMNTYGMGGSQQSYAMTLSLALSGMLTTWMLNQPAILGQVPFSQLPAGPIAVISDIGYPQVGVALQLDASASFDPNGGQLSYHWDFGGGQQASGMAVTHTYTHVGQYTLTLVVTSARGSRQVKKSLTIAGQSATYTNQYRHRTPDTNDPNTDVILPTPDDSLHDRIIRTPIEG